MVWLQHCSGWSPHTFPPRWRQYPSSAIVCSVFPSRTCIPLQTMTLPLRCSTVFHGCFPGAGWLHCVSFLRNLLVSTPLTCGLALGLSLSLILSTPISKPLFIICVAVFATYLLMLGIIFRFIVAHNNKDMGWFGALNSCICKVVKGCWKFLECCCMGLVWFLKCFDGDSDAQAESLSPTSSPPSYSVSSCNILYLYYAHGYPQGFVTLRHPTLTKRPSTATFSDLTFLFKIYVFGLVIFDIKVHFLSESWERGNIKAWMCLSARC